jgi:hypothetical protein
MRDTNSNGHMHLDYELKASDIEKRKEIPGMVSDYN